MNSLGDGHLPGYLGVVITDVRPGLLLAELPLREHLFAPNGYLHAGSVVSLADTAAGYACLAHLPEGASFTTLELKANFVRAVREGVLRCEARAVHLGRTTHIDDAKRAFEDFIALHPSSVRSAEASTMLGWLLLESGDAAGAKGASSVR